MTTAETTARPVILTHVGRASTVHASYAPAVKGQQMFVLCGQTATSRSAVSKAYGATDVTCSKCAAKLAH